MHVDGKSKSASGARNFIHAINPNETGYISFSLPRSCFRKGLFLANLINIQNVFPLTKTERSPKLRFTAHKCIEVIMPGFLSSSLSHSRVNSARSKALKLSKRPHQYVAMAAAEPISIFLC